MIVLAFKACQDSNIQKHQRKTNSFILEILSNFLKCSFKQK